MKVIIQRDYEQMSRLAAQLVAEVLNTKPNAVLGMATGSTPQRCCSGICAKRSRAGSKGIC